VLHKSMSLRYEPDMEGIFPHIFGMSSHVSHLPHTARHDTRDSKHALQGSDRLHPHSLHSHATLLLEWCDKIKLSNLLLPRKSVTIKILQLLSTSGVRVDPLCREPSRRPELYASFSFCSCTSSSACIRHLISQNASFKLFQKVNSPAKPSTYCLLLLIKKKL
jgi:hypothetical protein